MRSSAGMIYRHARLSAVTFWTKCRGFSHVARDCYEVVPSCPKSSCRCETIPTGLDIDFDSNIHGRMPFYTTHIVTCTRQNDWSSKIEDDPRGWLAKDIKQLFKDSNKNSPLEQPQIPLISCSSLQPRLSSDSASATGASIYLFPQFKYVRLQRESRSLSISLGLLPQLLERLSSDAREASYSQLFNGAGKSVDLDGFSILICGHGGRDERCGIVAPYLSRAFRRKLPKRGFVVQDKPPVLNGRVSDSPRTVRIGHISHIGGHKWAGNLIVYVSPHLTNHPLAGRGVWYGRVGPQHIDGIIRTTLERGIIVEELLRGVTEVFTRSSGD